MQKIHNFQSQLSIMYKTLFIILLSLLPRLVFAQTDSARTDTRDIMKEHAKNDHVILDWNWLPKDSSFITVEVSFLNPYEKNIKKMWLTFSAFDAKGKPVKDLKTGKTTIIIESDRIHAADGGYIDYKFEKIFNSKSVDEMKVEQVKLEFADNSIKIIKGPKAVGEP